MTRRRLRWERPWQEHLQLYRALFADPAVARALWPAGSARGALEDRGEEVLAADIRHWQERSFGPWAFFSTETGLFVGRLFLRPEWKKETVIPPLLCSRSPSLPITMIWRAAL